MSWFRNSPFASSDDAAAHMVALVAAEAEKIGNPLSHEDRRLLLEQWIPLEITEEDPAAKFRKLIEQTFDHESQLEDPMSFNNSIQWAGADRYPRIVALAEEVIRSRGDRSPRLRGRRAIIDLVQLIGCGVVSVVLLMLFSALIIRLFGHR